MDKKYYWYITLRNTGKETIYAEFVSFEHPCTRDKKNRNILLNWREITEEDYNLFKKMENE